MIITTRLRPSAREEIIKLAAEKDLSIAQYISEILETLLEKRTVSI